MAIFEISAWSPAEKISKKLFYNSSLSTLTWENGSNVIAEVKTQPDVVSPAKIEHGKKDLKIVSW